jgi:hypothetical protein
VAAVISCSDTATAGAWVIVGVPLLAETIGEVMLVVAVVTAGTVGVSLLTSAGLRECAGGVDAFVEITVVGVTTGVCISSTTTVPGMGEGGVTMGSYTLVPIVGKTSASRSEISCILKGVSDGMSATAISVIGAVTV